MIGTLAVVACVPGIDHVRLDGGDYWVYTPPDLVGSAPAIVHLHHSGDGRAHVTDPDLRADLDATGTIGVFPMGGGAPGDDWNVGVNKDHIPRDDRAWLTALAWDVRDRYPASIVALSGFSKGGAMVYDVACLGEPTYDAFLPMSGAFQDWVPDGCPHEARPIRHVQGRGDDRWPVHTSDDPDSSHEGIVDSLAALAGGTDGCLDVPPVIEDDCEVWDTCPVDVRLCWFDGGHYEPEGFLAAHRAWLDAAAIGPGEVARGTPSR